MSTLRLLFISSVMALTALYCEKDSLPLDAPENELLSKVTVLRRTNLIQEVSFRYDNLNRVTLIDINNLEGTAVREKVRYEYTDSTVVIRFSFLFEGGEEDAFEMILHKDADGYINAFKSVAPFQKDTLKVSVIRDPEKNIIAAVDIPDGAVINEYIYNEFGLEQTNLLNPGDQYHRREILEYDLLESYVPGINDIPFLTQLARDAYPFQPAYLLNTGFIINPLPRFLPKTRTTSLDDETTNRQIFSFDYARDRQGRMREVRKYTPDLINDVRMKFSYVRKK